MTDTHRELSHEKLLLNGIEISKEKVDFLNNMNSLIFSNPIHAEGDSEPECFISPRIIKRCKR